MSTTKRRSESEFLRLASDCTVLKSGKGHALILRERQVHDISGQIYVELADHLTTSIDRRSLISKLTPAFPPGEIESALRHFKEIGVLVDTLPTQSRSVEAFWNDAPRPERPPTISLQCFSPVGKNLLERLLAGNGVRVEPGAPFAGVVTDDYLRPEILEYAAGKQPWLLAKVLGRAAWIGPYFVPDQTACWWCLAHFLRTQRWQQCALFGFTEDSCPPQPSVAALPSTISFSVGMLGTALTKLAITGQLAEFEDCVVTFDTLTLKSAKHPLRRRSWCPHCGYNPVRRVMVTLDDLASPITGIVSDLVISDKPRAGFFNARAHVVMPLPVQNVRPMLKPISTFGTGETPEQAQERALGEAAERYSSTYQGREQLTLADADDLDCIRPDELLCFSDEQYSNRESWNREHIALHWIPEQWKSHQRINWVQVQSVKTGRKRYAPAGYCYLWYAFHGEPVYCCPDSNGCAAGRSREEALLSGFLELIERDAVAIWWYNRVSRPEVCWWDDEQLRHYGSYFNALDRNLVLLDITSDIGIPVYVAIAAQENGDEPLFASGAHTSPRAAALRAIRELGQILFWTERDGAVNDLQEWLKVNTRDHSYLLPNGSVRLPKYKRKHSTASDLSLVARQLAYRNLEPYYLDLTRSEIGVVCIRAIVPGLRHCWARFGPGRLYEVPYELGWCDSRTPENGLNPVPCML